MAETLYLLLLHQRGQPVATFNGYPMESVFATFDAAVARHIASTREVVALTVERVEGIAQPVHDDLEIRAYREVKP